MQPESENIFLGCYIRVFAFIYLLTFWIRCTDNLLTQFIGFYCHKKNPRFLRHRLSSGTGDDEFPVARLAGTYSWPFSLVVLSLK